MEAALSYEDFGQAMTSMAPAWPLITMKTNTCTYFMDWGKVACDFAEYTADRASTLENRPTLSGINVSLKLIEVLESIRIGNARKDARIFGTLKEHKNVLLKKAQFFIACGIPFEDEHLTAKYEELYKLADLCEKLFLKYEITGNAEIIGRMISLLRSIFTIEKDVIDTTKRGLIRYLEKIKWDKPVGFNDRQTSIQLLYPRRKKTRCFFNQIQKRRVLVCCKPVNGVSINGIYGRMVNWCINLIFLRARWISRCMPAFGGRFRFMCPKIASTGI